MRFAVCWLLVIIGSVKSETPLLDMVPGVAQIKSAVQLLAGDTAGAATTQSNYFNSGLGPSQLRSAYYLATGDPNKAGGIQLKFLNDLECVADGLPIVGHAKGVFHLLNNDTEHGWRAIKSSTSSVGTVVGAIAGGPAGAIGGHLLTDVLITGVDSIINGKPQPHGIVDYVSNIKKVDVGGHFDAVTSIVLDAVGAKVGTNTGAKTGVKTGAKATKGEFDVTKQLNSQTRVESELVSVDRLTDIKENVGVRAESKHIVQGNFGLENVEPKLTPRSSIAFKFVSNELTNRIKQIKFNDFLTKLAQRKVGRTWTSFSLKDLRPYTQNQFIQNLDIFTLTNKLTYLYNAEHHTLIAKNDFRLINTIPHEPNCLGCSVGGILGIDVDTLQNSVLKLSSDEYSSWIGGHLPDYLDMCEFKNLLTYERSGVFDNIFDIDLYLKTNFNYLLDKHLILGQFITESYGHAVVLKYKMSPDGLSPIKLMIDFQEPPMLTPELPNPERFQHFFDEKKYKYYEIYSIKLE